MGGVAAGTAERGEARAALLWAGLRAVAKVAEMGEASVAQMEKVKAWPMARVQTGT